MKETIVRRNLRKHAATFLVVMLLMCVVSTAGGQSKLNPQPAPAPVKPLPGGTAATNPMMDLAKTQNYSAARISSYQQQGGPRDNIYVPTDGSEVTIAEIQGPGAITQIWTTHRGNGQELIIRFYWEGRDHPSVEAPLGDFFGVALGLDAPMDSLPIQNSSEGRARNCWWYMPFNKSARVTVQATDSPANRERKSVAMYYYINYLVYNEPIEDLNYFHARFIETDPAPRGQSILLAEAEGSGHFVGLVMGHRTRTACWFGEGDDIITVDGKVSHLGTGTEDCFGDAWGFRQFSNLYYGVPTMEGREIGDGISAYRFYIMDPIPFRKSFKYEIEHWPWLSPLPNTGRGYYSSVGFWYQKTIHKPWPRLGKLISHEPWDPTKGRWHFPMAIEAEELEVVSHQSSAEGNPAPRVEFVMPNLSGDHMLLFDTGGKGKFSLAVPVDEAGTYTVTIYYPRAPEYGCVQLTVNGKAVGKPIDTYLRRDDLVRPLWPPKPYAFPGVRLKKGVNTFEFSASSKNPESDGYEIGIDCLVLSNEKK